MRSASRPAFWLLTVGGLGRLRPAPGTWGSLPPVALAAGLIFSGHGPVESPWLYHIALGLVVVIFSIACIAQGHSAEILLGKDPSDVVADETAGQSIALVALPAASIGTAPKAALTLAIAFVAFRVLDIVKPWPARQIQRAHGGWGILLDDLFAGVYALAIVQAVIRIVL
ncbi:MAG: phosphatidylglycerophosphatase A [Phycisphaerales bacterium]|nr:phosphatidylglycerophosphatase A [Phycisphaerales bacterium]